MKRYLTLVGILFLFKIGVAQESFPIKFRIYPTDAVAKIDGKVYDISKEGVYFTINLENGAYPIEIWAEHYKVFKDTLLVKGRPRNYAKSLLQRSDNFNEYRKARSKVKFKRTMRLVKTGLIVAANLGIAAMLVDNEINGPKRLENLEQEAVNLSALQLNIASPAQLDQNRKRYKDVQDEHKNETRGIYLKRGIGIPVFVASSYFSYKYLKKLWERDLKFPTLKAEKNPLVIENIGLQVDPSSIGFNLKLEF